jgi:hypothetical protein
MVSEWCPNGVRMVSEWCPNGVTVGLDGDLVGWSRQRHLLDHLRVLLQHGGLEVVLETDLRGGAPQYLHRGSTVVTLMYTLVTLLSHCCYTVVTLLLHHCNHDDGGGQGFKK